jgi:hypothetical protein
MVVDLAVVDDPRGVVLVRHRLLSRGDVHDGQATMGKADGAVDPQAFTVGAAVTDDVTHPLEARFVHSDGAVESHDAGDAAHTLSLPSSAA